MKRILFTSLLFMSAALTFAFTPAVPDTNKTDNHGKKTGIWKERTGQLDYFGNYRNDLKEGLWVSYHANGIVSIIDEYHEGRRNGYSFLIDKTGMHYQREYYVDDTLDGLSITYFPGGKIKSEIEYKMGIVHGVKRSYYNDGKLQEEGRYSGGLRNGISKWFYSEGPLSIQYTYKNGNLEGEQRSFYRNGNISSEGRYVNNLEEGDYHEYYENGNLKISGKYLKGTKHGAWKEFDENGKLIKTETYKNGELRK